MSYQVLARKWRPKNFHEMAGQTHVLQTLTHALEQQRLHHAYLFTGTRGVGKTTVARILARCLNCETGITATPCGSCDACREISEGRFIDLIEVDAASRTRVEDTRELLENVQYAPARGRFKVYLIDEVHMLSTHSFNALLKTLEEPPPHVKFLLATTDPQKLPVTVLSRCLQFHLKNLAPAQIVTYLQSVLTAEQIDFEEDALWQLARAAGGSMRDALTLLDQSISCGGGRVHGQAVTALLGTPDHSMIIQLLEALAQRDGARLINLTAEAAENNPDFLKLLEHLLSTLHRLALAQALPEAIDNSEGDREQVAALAASLAAEDVQLYYQFAVQALQEMQYSPDRRASFEMSLLRMLAFSPDVFAGQIRQEKKKPLIQPVPEQTAPAADLSPEPESEPVPEPVPKKAPEPISASAPEPAPLAEQQAISEQELQPQPKQALQPQQDPQLQPETPAATEATAESAPGLSGTADDDQWYALVARCGLTGFSGNILWNCVPGSITENHYSLLLDINQSALYTPDHAESIAAALSDSLGTSVTVTIDIAKLSTESPAARRAREKQQAIDALHQNFYNDPGVMALVKTFDASIEQLRTQYDRS